MNPIVRNLFIIVAVVTVLFFGYDYIKNPSEVPPPLQTEGVVVGDVSGSRDFLVTLSNLKKIDFNLSGAVFKNEVFVNLRDMSVGLPSDAKGRPNPFSPIGEDVISSAGSSSAIPKIPSVPPTP